MLNQIAKFLPLFFLTVNINLNKVYAQDGGYVVTQDFETWTTIGAKFKPNKKWTLGLEQGLRLQQNSSITDQVLTELNIKWQPIKLVEVGLGTRYTLNRGNNEEFDNDFRWNLDIALKHKIKRFDFKYRIRYQNKNEIGLSKVDGDINKNYLRIKLATKYNIKNWKFDPEFSGEIFRDLTKYTGSFDKIRWTIGTSYNFKRAGEIGLYYRMERDLGVNYPKTTSIIGLNYVYTFKKRNNEKK